MHNKESVEVYSDRTYTIVETLDDGTINIIHRWTKSLGQIIDFLQEIDKWIESEANVVMMACCYEQYQGSYNVVVNMKAQRERIIQYANAHYKTFSTKYITV